MTWPHSYICRIFGSPLQIFCNDCSFCFIVLTCFIFIYVCSISFFYMDLESEINFKQHCNVCEKFQTTRAKVAPVNLIYGSHFSATEATYEVSQNRENFVESLYL